MKSILIKDTTKEEREKIVADALGCGSDCSMCCACGGMEIDYQQYIDGKKEVAQLNAEYRANTMIGHQEDFVFAKKTLFLIKHKLSSPPLETEKQQNPLPPEILSGNRFQKERGEFL